MRVTPGSTATEKSSTLSSEMATMRLKSKQTPPWHSTAWHGQQRAVGVLGGLGAAYLHGVDTALQASASAEGHHGHTVLVADGHHLL